MDILTDTLLENFEGAKLDLDKCIKLSYRLVGKELTDKYYDVFKKAVNDFNNGVEPIDCERYIIEECREEDLTLLESESIEAVVDQIFRFGGCRDFSVLQISDNDFETVYIPIEIYDEWKEKYGDKAEELIIQNIISIANACSRRDKGIPSRELKEDDDLNYIYKLKIPANKLLDPMCVRDSIIFVIY